MGLSQREIARRTGTSQSNVSKRLDLLTLPDVLQDALRSESLGVTDAGLLVKRPADHAVSIWADAQERDIPVSSAIQAFDTKRNEEEQIHSSRVRAAEEGLDLIDPSDRFGSARWEHRLNDADDIEEARKRNTLIAALGKGGTLEYYTTVSPAAANSTPPPTSSPKVPAQADPGAAVGTPPRQGTETRTSTDTEAELRRRAAHARSNACRELVNSRDRLDSSAMLTDLARYSLAGAPGHREAVQLTYTWLGKSIPTAR